MDRTKHTRHGQILDRTWNINSLLCSIADTDNRPEFVVEVEEPGFEPAVFKVSNRLPGY